MKVKGDIGGNIVLKQDGNSIPPPSDIKNSSGVSYTVQFHPEKVMKEEQHHFLN